MVNAPEGLNQVILRKVRRIDCRIFLKILFLRKTSFFGDYLGISSKFSEEIIHGEPVMR